MDRLSITMKCTSPWRTALLVALVRLVQGFGWQVTSQSRFGFEAVLKRFS
jgi:hypothetical protein